MKLKILPLAKNIYWTDGQWQNCQINANLSTAAIKVCAVCMRVKPPTCSLAVNGVGPDVVSGCTSLTHCFVWIAEGKIQTKRRKILEPSRNCAISYCNLVLYWPYVTVLHQSNTSTDKSMYPIEGRVLIQALNVTTI